MFIALHGKQRAGKDTFARLLLIEMERQLGKDPYFYFFRFSDSLYVSAAAAWGVDVAYVRNHKNDFRPLLQVLGQMRRKLTPNFFAEKLKGLIDSDRDVIIPDLRTFGDIEDIQGVLGTANGILVKIEASEEVRRSRGGIVGASHTTETDLDNFDNWWEIIDNNGSIGALYQQASDIADRLINEPCQFTPYGW